MRGALAVGLLFVLAGCGPSPARREPAVRDDAPRDTFEVLARSALDHWDAGESAQAAGAAAGAMIEALRRRPEAPWAARVRGLADSLGIFAEVAGRDDIALVNFRSRDDPEGDSWPWLMWREADGPHQQALEGPGMQLAAVATRGFAGGTPTDTAQLATVWLRRGGVGAEPALIVWRRVGGRWDLLQTLTSDSLGGTGQAEFVGAADGPALETRTFRRTQGFDECPTCPHVHRDRRFEWTPRGFRKVDDRPLATSYSTFTAFIRALQGGDVLRAEALVVDPMLVEFARRFAWDDAGRGMWRVEPGTNDSMPEMIFLRGSSEAFRVTFEARENDWRIAGFEPTERVIE